MPGGSGRKTGRDGMQNGRNEACIASDAQVDAGAGDIRDAEANRQYPGMPGRAKQQYPRCQGKQCPECQEQATIPAKKPARTWHSRRMAQGKKTGKGIHPRNASRDESGKPGLMQRRNCFDAMRRGCVS
ncbi:MAG: hypothetical protein ACOX4M_01335 [Acetivibrionales bacterium]